MSSTREVRNRIEESPLSIEMREAFWLAEIHEGTSIRAIARREGVSSRRIQLGITRARLSELGRSLRQGSGSGSASSAEASGSKPDAKNMPRLIPLFPIGPFTPSSTCGHRHPIRAGSVFCCMICHTSGLDDHPGLKRDPQTDPKPEPKPVAAPSAARVPKSCKPRRVKQYARHQAVASTTVS